MRFVYTIYNKKADKIYIGETGDIEKRLREHNEKRGNHFTAKFAGKWELVYKEEFENKQESLKREKQLKSFKGREFVRKHIIKS